MYADDLYALYFFTMGNTFWWLKILPWCTHRYASMLSLTNKSYNIVTCNINIYKSLRSQFAYSLLTVCLQFACSLLNLNDCFCECKHKSTGESTSKLRDSRSVRLSWRVDLMRIKVRQTRLLTYTCFIEEYNIHLDTSVYFHL